ncbi:Protein esc1 [Phlyctema vagabunda]|uniref:Protein esc1 n=1 Tax=Phlyctema vagabunda TaxID=108571 RepID=A0ABR4P2X0_9HELO
MAQRLSSTSTSKAPNGLDKVLNQSDEPRDSGFFANDSKHTSMNSTNALTPSSTGGYQSSPADHTPSPIATGNDNLAAGLSLASPMSAMSVAAMVSPTGADHALNRRSDGVGYDSARNSAGYPNGDSRRESVSSSVYQNMGELRLTAGSPYTSQNPSTTSLQESLQQQRNPGERPGYARFSNSYQPSCARTPEVTGPYSRKAPAITGPAPGAIARAAEATKGQAWAFPEVEVQRIPSATRPSGEGAPGGYQDSRRSSIASIASSQYTTESRYPPSQRRLEDNVHGDFNRLSRASSEFQGPAQQHHHHQLTRLQSEEANSPTGSSQPYSRTPELRVTHKLAERKRRTEMKDLFEKLGAKLPSDGRSTKSSKWEILSKAISEHDRMTATINSQNHTINAQNIEAQALRHRLAAYEGGGQHVVQQSNGITPNSVPYGSAAAPPPYWGNSQSQASSHERQELPPLRSLPQVAPYASSQAMTGVEYPVTAMNSAGPYGEPRRPF